MFYFHAARAFTVCIPAGSRTVRPLHAFAGAGPHLHSPEPLSLYGGVGGDTPSLFFYAVAAIRHISADPIEAHSHEI